MKRLLNILIILLVLDMLGLGALWFGYSTIAAKKDDEVKLEKEIVDETQKTLQLATLRRTLNQAERESTALTKYFYDSGEESQINFVAQMEALGKTTSGALVKTSSFDFGGGTAPNFHGEFAVTGTWKAVYYYLRLLETFPARLIIRRFNVVSSGEKDPQTATWQGGASINLVSIKSI